MESGHASRHYVLKREKYRPFVWHRWPKLTVVCHTNSHLFVAAVVSQGPGADHVEFGPAIRQACSHLGLDRLLGDTGYDSEGNHRLAREELGIRSTVFPLNPRNSGDRCPKTRYRRQMKTQFPCRKYRQRWQVESCISRHKRRLGSALRARQDATREAECYVRVLTHDLMVLRSAA